MECLSSVAFIVEEIFKGDIAGMNPKERSIAFVKTLSDLGYRICAAEELGAIAKQSGEAPNQQLKAEIAALITEYVTDIERGELHKMALFISKLRQLSAV